MNKSPSAALEAAQQRLDAHDNRETERRARLDRRRQVLAAAVVAAERSVERARRQQEQRTWAMHNEALAADLARQLGEREQAIAHIDNEASSLTVQASTMEADIERVDTDLPSAAGESASALLDREMRTLAARSVVARLRRQAADLAPRQAAIVAGVGHGDSMNDLRRELVNARAVVASAMREIARLDLDEEPQRPQPAPAPDLLHPLDRARVQREANADYRPVMRLSAGVRLTR